MTTRSHWNGGIQRFYEDVNFETVGAGAALQFYDDFINSGGTIPDAASPSIGFPWVKKIVGAAPPTAAYVANARGGQAALTLTNASQKQEASIYFNDVLALDVTKGLNIEFRAALSVAPDAAEVQVAFGAAQAWADGPDNSARYVQFGATADANLDFRSKDAVGSVVSTGAARIGTTAAIALDTNFHTFRIDASNASDVAFLYDGNRVNAVGSVAWAATSANSLMQLYASVYKASGTGVGTLTIDSVRAWATR